MPFELQFRRYPTDIVNALIGRDGELIIEEVGDQRQLRILDGQTPGGAAIMVSTHHITTALGENLDQILENLSPLEHDHDASEIYYDRETEETVADILDYFIQTPYAREDRVLFRDTNNQQLNAVTSNFNFTIGSSATNNTTLRLGPANGSAPWNGIGAPPLATSIAMSLRAVSDATQNATYNIRTRGHNRLDFQLIGYHDQRTAMSFTAEETGPVQVTTSSLHTNVLTLEDTTFTGEVSAHSDFENPLAAREWLKVKINNNEVRYLRLFEEVTT